MSANPGSQPAPMGEIILYQTEDGQTRVECRFADESLWLSQTLMAELFQTTPQNITLHLKALYQEGEIEEAATCKDYLQVRAEGRRQVRREVKHYSLDAILAVGYRVRSSRGTQFCEWRLPDTVFPVVWFPFQMHDGDDQDLIIADLVDHPIGETARPTAPGS